jgi:two-component system LytT family response regulator
MHRRPDRGGFVKIRTLIVDDEPLARQRLRKLLEADPEITIVGECGDGRQAVADLQELQPDLAFLDVQMPVLDGFDVLEALVGQRMPVVIFVTAYDRYAVKAFEVQALDYLLKPFDKDRFMAALQRAKDQLRQAEVGNLEDRLRQLLQVVPNRPRAADRLVVKSAGRVYFVRHEDIDWIEAAGNYVRLHAGKEEHLLRQPLGALESKLDARRFVRIHRSTIVNIDRIREVQAAFHGESVVFLHDGTELAVSRGHREKLEEAVGHSL